MTPVLPALNQTQSSFGDPNAGSASARRTSSPGKKFYFGTKQASDSVGAKEDPIQARRLKLSQVAFKDNSLVQDDATLANMIYGTQVNT